MENKMRFFIALVFLISSVQSYAVEPGAPSQGIALPEFKPLSKTQSANEACRAGVAAAKTALAKGAAVDASGTVGVGTQQVLQMELFQAMVEHLRKQLVWVRQPMR